jgi:hypothetical protein
MNELMWEDEDLKDDGYTEEELRNRVPTFDPRPNNPPEDHIPSWEAREILRKTEHLINYPTREEAEALTQEARERAKKQ